jgi:class 3 adenylate cyclase/tRNA A-37 threonylcarbamoyl transferase component Bud32
VTERANRRAVNPPTGTVTFLFTDIEGSTFMWERNPAQMAAALVRHDEILRTTMESHGGYVFKTVGDAFCAAFITTSQALKATLATQRALFAESWDEDTAIRVRMALHTGATEERDGDYFGPPVNRVARLISAGHGGQILLSAVTYGLARDTVSFLEPGAEFKDLGEHRLKDLKYPEHIYQLVVPDLPSEFSTLKTLDTRSDERYALARLIGSGGMAEVYLARDRELDRDVAFKALKHRYAEDEQFVERFKREARNVASLSHPNIVQVYDRGETQDGSYYIVMEWVPGGTLEERILREGPLPPAEATAVALQVARALCVAHRRNVIHRDIKPQNILLAESGEAKVADFGIAKAAACTVATQEGVIPGTPHYVSPEQVLGQPATPQSDLYSLGVVLYEMLTGRVPHDAETPIGIAMKHVSGQLHPPKEVNPDVPEGINAVTTRLLAREPENRYQSADELVEDLERIGREQSPELATRHRAGRPAQGVPVGPGSPGGGGQPPQPSPGRQPWRRGLLPWAATGLLAAVLLGIGIFLVGQFFSGREEESSVAVSAGGGPPLEESSTPGYVVAKDNSGKLSVEVPSEWSNVDGTTWDFRGGKIGLGMVASSDLDAWYRYYRYRISDGAEGSSSGFQEASGVFFGVSKSLASSYPEDTEDQVLDLKEYNYSDICDYDSRDDYDDGTYSGKYDTWTNCGGSDNNKIFILAATPKDRAYVMMIRVQTRSEADLEAQRHVLDTFKVAEDP